MMKIMKKEKKKDNEGKKFTCRTNLSLKIEPLLTNWVSMIIKCYHQP